MHTTEQLQRLTELINERLGEFGVNGGPVFEPLTLGQVRLFAGAYEQWQHELEEPAIAGIAGRSFSMSANGQPLSMSANEPALISLLLESNGNGSAPVPSAESGKLERELSEIVEAIQQMSVGGHMPSVRYYDSRKPDHLPNWQTMLRRHDLTSWGQLAQLCGLKTVFPGYRGPTKAEVKMERKPIFDGERPPGGDEDEIEEIDDFDDDEPQPVKRSTGFHRNASMVEREAERKKQPKSTYTPSLAEVVAELKRQSMAGVMPTLAQFDAARPANWATGQAHMLRLKLSWPQLAQEAGLKPRRASAMVTEEQA